MPNAVGFGSAGSASQLIRAPSTNNICTATFTVMGWMCLSGAGGAEYQTFFGVGYSGNWTAFGIESARKFHFDWGSASTGSTVLKYGTWYHVAIVHRVVASLGVDAYLNGKLELQATGYAYSSATNWLGGYDANASYWMNGRLAAIKAWKRALSAAEVRAEMPFALPVSRVGLHSCYPVPSVLDTLRAREYGPPGYGDWSSNKRDWTKTGVVTIVPGPPQLR